MRTHRLLLAAIVVSAIGCSPKIPPNTLELAPLAGCWMGGEVSHLRRPPSELRFFGWREDSSLALSMTYEIAPRSRVRTSDLDVTVSEGVVRWDDHEGYLSENKDTLMVVRRSTDGRSLLRFVRHTPADSLLARFLACDGGPYTYAIPDARADGWQCAHMGVCGLDTGRITALIDEIVDGRHDDIHSMLIAKDGKLVVEEYFAVNGERHGSFVAGLFRDRVHHLASTTKSVTSILVGIAIDRGLIGDVSDPISRYLPSYASLFTGEKQRITISHMLTMTPGFAWRQFRVSDDLNDGMRMWRSEDVIRLVLEKPLEAEPGERFNYTNGVPTVTGAILRNATGMRVEAFAEEFLFRPLGISGYMWTSYPDGSLETDGGLALRPRDLAKIGQLFLDGGSRNGHRIVSEEWVRASTKERVKMGGSTRWGYGYHWMRTESRVGDRVVESYFVPGDGNQILAVFPGLRMVVVFTAGNYGKDPKPVYYDVFEEHILPAALADRRSGG